MRGRPPVSCGTAHELTTHATDMERTVKAPCGGVIRCCRPRGLVSRRLCACQAALISSRRTWLLRTFVIDPRRCDSPEECSVGTRPTSAVNRSAVLNRPKSPISPTSPSARRSHRASAAGWRTRAAERPTTFRRVTPRFGRQGGGNPAHPGNPRTCAGADHSPQSTGRHRTSGSSILSRSRRGRSPDSPGRCWRARFQPTAERRDPW
jgi:hypothetical protein